MEMTVWKEGSRYLAHFREENIGEEASKGRSKIDTEIQIPQQKELSIKIHRIRTFVKEQVFYQLGFVTLFYNHALLTEHCSETSLSLSGRPSDVNICQVTLPTAHITQSHNRSTKYYHCISNQASQIPVAGTAQRLEKSELCGINSSIFLQKIFEWQGNLPMRLQMGNKPEKYQHLEILAVFV